MTCFIGIDVGTGSARAGVFATDGARLGIGSHPIGLRHPAPDIYEQSSDDIWTACAAAVRAALGDSGRQARDIGGIGFDATCSLVVLDGGHRPLAVSPHGKDEWNVIVWMDHRAIAEAAAIDAAGHPLLAHVGGTISPEMQTPKLAWLKRHNPDSWARAAHFLDLADFLSLRASGSLTRSMCTTVCKWAYVGGEGRWDADWFARAGVGELTDDGFARIGRDVAAIATRAGGLTAAAAADLGLAEGTPVGVGAIDAHAGGIGAVGGAGDVPIERRLAMIAGTSTCHLIASAEPRFVPGVWGPYHGAMLPDRWLNEGGQSATGALIDHVIATHATGRALLEEARAQGDSVYARLNDAVAALDAGVMSTRELHVFPDFHGNRSPWAEPGLRGMISGLTLDDGAHGLTLLYLATLQALALGTRLIVDRLEASGARIEAIVLSGGAAKNALFVRTVADALRRPVLLPVEEEAMLLGSAMIAATAAGAFAALDAAMAAMGRFGETIAPDPASAPYYDAKYAVLQRMYADQHAYRALMASRQVRAGNGT